MSSLAERLKEARLEAGLKQPQLAKQAGVSPGTIGNAEAGIRTELRELLAIARAVNVNAEWLKTGKGPKRPTPENGSEHMTGWPLSPELLAALQCADERTRRQAENVARALLGMSALPGAQETAALSA